VRWDPRIERIGQRRGLKLVTRFDGVAAGHQEASEIESPGCLSRVQHGTRPALGNNRVDDATRLLALVQAFSDLGHQLALGLMIGAERTDAAAALKETCHVKWNIA
jgi:hypothetical protein